jgi:transcription initiation factor IIE alpha subunit
VAASPLTINNIIVVFIKSKTIYMDFQTYAKKMGLVEHYIENKWANTPDALAEKLGTSKRTVLRMINHLKDNGKQIAYCKKEKIYKIFVK